MQHVVIGAGPSGVVAAEALRKLQPKAEITLVGEEPEPPYSRMALPYFLIKQIKEEGLESKFIGKNFVFDNRLGERITDDIVSQCHQCGKPCDNHTNCENDGCHLLFIQCDECKSAMDNCCSTECLDIIHMPLVDQVRLRTGQQVGNKVFRKGKCK